MAAGIFTGLAGSFINSSAVDTVLLARPADALDDDGDGIPLLQEEAHCLDRFSPDSGDGLPTGFASRSADGEVLMGYSVRIPLVETASPEPAGLRAGEFVYSYQVSTLLDNWTPETFIPGSVEVVGSAAGAITADSVCIDRGISVRYSPGFVTENPRRFSRLEVTRDR